LRLVTAIILVLFCSAGASAQQHLTIKGHITNEKGKPVAGASVAVVGTSIGTVSDDEGHYALSIPRANKGVELLFTHGECAPQRLRVSSAKREETLDVVLRESTNRLEEVVVRGETDASRTRNRPLSVSVLETKNIATKAISNADLLGKISGVNVRQNGGLGSDVSISINGMSGRQIRIFMDGIPLEHYSGELSMGSLPATFFERFEVYKGAVPTTLASDALGGAVNMVSRDDARDFVDLTYGAGSFNTHKIILNSRHALGKHGYFGFNGFANHSDNNYTIDAEILDKDGNSRFGKVKRFHNAFANFMVRPELGLRNVPWADRAFLSLYVSGNRLEPQHNALATQPYGDILSKNSAFGTLLSYKKQQLVKNLDLDAYAVANFARPRLIDTSLNVYNWAGDVVFVRNQGAEISGSGNDLYLKDRTFSGQVNARWHFVSKISLSGSLQRSHFHRTGRDPFMEAFYGRDYYASPQSTNKTIAGLSLKAVLLDDRFTSVTSAKYFDFRAQGYSRGDVSGLVEASSQKEKLGFGQAFSYRFRNGISLKTSYEYATRLPSTYELFGDQMLVLANLALRPETSHNISAGLTYRSARMNVEMNGFYRHTDDVIWQRPGSRYIQHQNLSKSLAKGIEGEVGYQLLESLRLGLNATYQDIRSRSDLEGDERYYGRRIPNIPYLFGNADLRYAHGKPLWDRLTWSAWGGMRYVHDFFLFWEGDGRRETKNVIPEQYSANIGVSLAEKTGKYTVSLDCQNLFDRKLYDNFKVQKPGRAFYVTLNYKI